MTKQDWAEETVTKMAVKDPALCALTLYSAGWRCAGLSAELDSKGYQVLRLMHPTRSGRGKNFIFCTIEVFNLIELIERGEHD